ncbi:MAG: DUF6259 domain-containing protein [Firmicutes bacterium]|nr:DUF6259 domain-containing protein [Bacillota bacterium]
MTSAPASITHENSLIKLVFDQSTGRLQAIWNKVTGDNYLKRPSAWRGHTLAVVCLDSLNRKVTLLPGEVEVMRLAAGSLTMTYSRLFHAGEAVPINAWITVAVAPDSPETLWTLKLENHASDLRVVEVLFPYFRGLQLGDAHTDDVIVYPHHAGEKTVNPVEKYPSARYLNFSRANTVKEADGAYSREINYCGLASMMWMDYYDPDGGLCLASYDPEFLLTGLRVETGGPDDPWMGLAMRKYASCDPGAAWTSHPYAVGIHTSDWHWGADRYRTWFQRIVPAPAFSGTTGLAGTPELPGTSRFRETPISARLREEYAVSPRYDFRNGGRVIHRFEEIPEMFEADRAEGVDHFFIAGWNRRGFDNNYPEYHPDMELGSPAELAEGCRYVNAHGGKVTFYINARIFDTASDYFPTSGQAWAVKDEQGSLSHETYEPRTFAVMCPDAPGWQKHLADTAAWMVKSYGARGIYLDQLGSATPLPCYDPAHGHSHHGQGHHGTFNHGYLKILAAVKAGIEEQDPQAFIMIENCGDVYGQYVSGNLTWNGELYDEFFNLYKYTFPDYVQVNMVHPRHIADRPARETYFYRDVERAMLLGSIFWVAFNRRFLPEDEDLKEYMRKALRMRRALAPYFAAGRFVDEIGLSAQGTVHATHWILDGEMGDPGKQSSRGEAINRRKPGHLIVVGNPDQRSDATIQFQPGATIQSQQEAPALQTTFEIRQLTLDGQQTRDRQPALEAGFSPAKARVEDGELILSVPVSRLSAFLIPGK